MSALLSEQSERGEGRSTSLNSIEGAPYRLGIWAIEDTTVWDGKKVNDTMRVVA